LPDPKHLPSVEALSQFEAVRLFIDRALMVQPSFAVTNANAPAVAQICQRLDGIPLALELAASRVKAIKVEELEKRLDDRFRVLTGGSRTALPRQQTLRAAIDWSYDLLSEAERTLLRRLAVFAGGWTLEAAELVCADEGARGIGGHDVLALNTQLADKSLIVLDEHADETRYQALETIRQYAREKLFESGEGERLRHLHLAYFLKLAEQGAPHMETGRQVEWLNRFESEHENLSAALRWSTDGGEALQGLRLALALAEFWEYHNHIAEARGWYAELLPQTEAGSGVGLRHKVLAEAARTTLLLEDSSTARNLYEETLELSRRRGDRLIQSRALTGLAHIALNAKRAADAWSLHQEALAVRIEMKDQSAITSSLLNLAFVSLYRGDYDGARLLQRQSLDIARALGAAETVALGLWQQALIEVGAGSPAAARAALQESLTLCLVLDSKSMLAYWFYGQAAIAAAIGQPSRAARLLGKHEHLLKLAGFPLWEALIPHHARLLTSVRDQLGEAAFKAAWEQGRALTVDQAVEFALRDSDD
jgi:non-specific serine/threonine protein kinase